MRLKTYQTSLERDPKNVVTHRNIGDVYARLGRTADARRSYEGAIAAATERLKINPSDAGTIALVALCEAKIGRAEAAERHAAEALALAPKDWNVIIKNAEVYTRLKRDDRALGYLRQAIVLGYDAASARRNHEFALLKNHPDFEPTLAAAPAPHR